MTDPVAHFIDVAASHDRCFWLDGGGSRPWSGRRSIIGWLDKDNVSLTYDARTRLVSRHAGHTSSVIGDDIFTALEAEMAGDDADVHWVGYFGYGSRADLPHSVDPDDPTPTAIWMRTRNIRVFEHPEPQAGQARAGAPPVDEPPVPQWYAEEFDRVQGQLRAGNSYEVNLTHRVMVDSDLDPVAAYLRLRELNPAPYAGFLQHDGNWLLSSSPERYATVSRDRMIETKPIKGTTARGDSPAEDDRLRTLLVTDQKFRAENLMIVDLLRNDLAMVCRVGSVEVPVLMEVESYRSVHQLVSTVRGHLEDGVTTIGALRTLFPAGSMTGAPKMRTMEIIRDVEATPRGVYAGAFGWVSGDGRADLGVIIRSLSTTGDGLWRIGTGGGITVRSEPSEEYAESRWKVERLLQVFDEAVSCPRRDDPSRPG